MTRTSTYGDVHIAQVDNAYVPTVRVNDSIEINVDFQLLDEILWRVYICGKDEGARKEGLV